MPKLRNGATDIAKFTQWIGRKCRNHNPLHELSLPARAKLPRMHKIGQNKGDLTMLTEEEGVLLYQAGGRLFEITVRELDEDIHEGKKRVAIGY